MKQCFEIAEKSVADINTKNIVVDGFTQTINKPLSFAKRNIHMLISIDQEKITLTKFEQPIYNNEALSINNSQIEVTNITEKRHGRYFCKEMKRFCPINPKNKFKY